MCAAFGILIDDGQEYGLKDTENIIGGGLRRNYGRVDERDTLAKMPFFTTKLCNLCPTQRVSVQQGLSMQWGSTLPMCHGAGIGIHEVCAYGRLGPFLRGMIKGSHVFVPPAGGPCITEIPAAILVRNENTMLTD